MRICFSILFTYFTFSATFVYSQRTTRLPLNLDSVMDARKKANRNKVGEAFPSFLLSGAKKLSNAGLKGKVVFMNFWFSTCPPCIAEFDALNNLYQDFRENGKFEFISFTYESPEEIERIKQKYNIQYNIFSLTHPECKRLNLDNGFPTTIILDTSGLIRYINVGGSTNKQQIKKYITNELYPLILKELQEDRR